jgi:anti-anti-sigma factor
MAPHALSIMVERRGPWIAVLLSGELTYASQADLDQRLSGLAAQEQPRICIDLGDLAWCDSSGVACLLRGCRAAREQGGTLVLSRPSGMVNRMLVLLGATSALTVIDELPA